MPSLTTEKRLPASACRRRAKTSGQRSSPFRVDAEPSVMESPKATIARVSDGAVMYTASRKYHDVDDSGKARSLSSLERNPAPGIDRYDVVIAFACHVIGPLSPATWKLTASRRPTSIGSAGLLTNGNDTGSDTTSAPGAIVTDGLPAKVTGRLVPASTAAPLFCRPRYPVEGGRLRAECIRQPNARLAAPDIRPHDQPKRLVARAPRGIGKGELHLRLRRRKAG